MNHPESELKSPFETVKDFSVNPFYSYQNPEDEHQNTIISSEKSEKIQREFIEVKVPLLFQTKPLKEVIQKVKKFEEMNKEKKIRIHEKQLEMVSEELKTLRAKPQISRNSQKIMENKTYVPLHLRTEEILNRKKEKLEEERKIKEKKNEELEKAITFRPELSTMPQTYKNFKEFEETQKNWTKTKKEKIAQKQFLHLEQEVQNHPFKPEINKNSLKIVHKKGFSQEKVEKRLVNDYEKKKTRKIQESDDQANEQFRPILNPKTEKIIQAKRKKANILVEFLNSSEQNNNINIQISSKGVELSVNET